MLTNLRDALQEESEVVHKQAGVGASELLVCRRWHVFSF